MFCTNCGKEIQKELKFCPFCNKEINENDMQIDTGSDQQQNEQPEHTLSIKPEPLKVLRILSILGLFLLPVFYFFSFISVEEKEQLSGYVFWLFLLYGYMIAHSIVAIIQGFKYRIVTFTIMGIIGIIGHAVSSYESVIYYHKFFFIQNNIHNYSGESLHIFFLLSFLYGIVFAIVSTIITVIAKKME